MHVILDLAHGLVLAQGHVPGQPGMLRPPSQLLDVVLVLLINGLRRSWLVLRQCVRSCPYMFITCLNSIYFDDNKLVYVLCINNFLYSHMSCRTNGQILLKTWIILGD